jgi:hypothetical protein
MSVSFRMTRGAPLPFGAFVLFGGCLVLSYLRLIRWKLRCKIALYMYSHLSFFLSPVLASSNITCPRYSTRQEILHAAVLVL